MLSNENDKKRFNIEYFEYFVFYINAMAASYSEKFFTHKFKKNYGYEHGKFCSNYFMLKIVFWLAEDKISNTFYYFNTGIKKKKFINVMNTVIKILHVVRFYKTITVL